jgi:hypothetical protein
VREGDREELVGWRWFFVHNCRTPRRRRRLRSSMSGRRPCRRRGRPLSCCALARACPHKAQGRSQKIVSRSTWCSYPSVEGSRAGTGLLGPSVLDIWFLVATGGSVGRPAGACVGGSRSDRAARPHDEDGPHSRLACRRSGRATAYPGNRYPLGPNVCASRADPGLPGGVSSRPPSSSTSCGTTS